MRVHFHNSHIVTTRYKDYYFVSASRNLQQGNERSRFYVFLWFFEALCGFKVFAVCSVVSFKTSFELSQNNWPAATRTGWSTRCVGHRINS